ncbi:hypothetical protein HDV05_000609, partial [Chytridiales sp. JEL 0842]
MICSTFSPSAAPTIGKVTFAHSQLNSMAPDTSLNTNDKLANHPLLQLDIDSLSTLVASFFYTTWFERAPWSAEQVDEVLSERRHLEEKAMAPERVARWQNEAVEYVRGMITYFKLTPSTVFLGLRYIRMICESDAIPNKESLFDPTLIIVAMMLARKQHMDDDFVNNRTWSDYSRIFLHDLNQKEREMLASLWFETHMSRDEFHMWVDKLDVFWRSAIEALSQTMISITTLATPTSTSVDTTDALADHALLNMS